MHPWHALLLLEQDEKSHNLNEKFTGEVPGTRMSQLEISSPCDICSSSVFLAQRPVGFTALLSSHQQFSLALPNPFPKGFEELVSLFLQKYHPINTRWHRWPPQGWRQAQVCKTGLDLFIQLIYEKPLLVLPPHPSLSFVTDTNLSSCFIFQQSLG